MYTYRYTYTILFEQMKIQLSFKVIIFNVFAEKPKHYFERYANYDLNMTDIHLIITIYNL